MKKKNVLILLILLLFVIPSINVSAKETKCKKGAPSYVDWMVKQADDPQVGYDQAHRLYDRNTPKNIKDVDCSSFVYFALIKYGYSETDLGGSWPFTTPVMGQILKNTGDFEEHKFTGTKDLKPGDICVNPLSHTEVYVGDGKYVGAHSSGEGSGVYAYHHGDQSGNEVSVQKKDPTWQYYYRMKGKCGKDEVDLAEPDVDKSNFFSKLFNNKNTQYAKCDSDSQVFSDRFIDILVKIYHTIIVLALVMAVILATLEFFKATASSDADALKKAWTKLGKRIIVMLLLFTLPSLLEILLTLFGSGTMTRCISQFQ